jgi:hypothetical protein
MPLPALRRVALLALAAVAAIGGSATGALVEVEDIVLHADGSFQPQTLPRHRYAPIDFQGRIDIAAKGGGRPPPLKQALIDFDRDGRLSVAGLPVCAPESIAQATPEEARRICRGAIVGTGRVEAMVPVEEGSPRMVPGSSPLTVFNGPRVGGLPSAVLHARTTVPSTETYAIVVPIEKIRGEFRYRARLDLPPFAGGLGALTHIDVEIGRRYRAGGRNRSYVAARCSDNILRTHGRFSFEDGTVIDGLVEKFCRSK